MVFLFCKNNTKALSLFSGGSAVAAVVVAADSFDRFSSFNIDDQNFIGAKVCFFLKFNHPIFCCFIDYSFSALFNQFNFFNNAKLRNANIILK